MSEHSIPVDLYNPGQVFACLGFLEAAEVLLGDAEARFDWSRSGSSCFLLRTSKMLCPFTAALDFVKSASRYSVSPEQDVRERDGGETRCSYGIYPSKLRDEGKLRNALLPVELIGNAVEAEGDSSRRLWFDYWTDFDSGRPFMRLWTATNGNSASIRFGKLHAALLLAMQNYDVHEPDPFNLRAPVAANFQLEPRRNWVSVNAGFSPDVQHKSGMPIEVATYPIVEIFAALAMTYARPRPEVGNASVWRYAAWKTWLPPQLARVAVAQGLAAACARHFMVRLEAPNDGGGLSMTYGLEEANS